MTTAGGSIVITATTAKPGSTTITYQITAVDPNNREAVITIYPASGVVYNDDTTYTFTRPSGGSADASYTVLASAVGFPTVSLTLVIPAQSGAVAGASLSIVPTVYSTYYSLAYTFTGTTTYTISGAGPYTLAPGSSPLTASRNSAGSADLTYLFHCVGADSSTVDVTVVVPAQAAAGATATDLSSCITLTNAIYTVLKAKGEMS